MKGKLLAISILIIVKSPVFAQVELVSDGDVVAHGVRRCGWMPEALQHALAGRRMEVRQPQASTSFTHRARPVARCVRQGDVASSPTTVGPLLLSIRDQEEPYNLLCPYWTYEDSTVSERRCLSGCVATCIEQMMAYYRYPEALIDTLHGWQTDNYVIEDLLPGTRFDWDNYLQDYRDGWTEAQGMAIALPSLAAGMAVHMQYGLAASGANVYRAVEPLQRAFGYGMVRYFDRILGISHDDETIPFTMPVNVRKGTRPQLEWGTVGARNVSETTDITYTFSVPVTNRAASGYAGNLVTFLYPDGGEAEDLRHYRVLSLQAGQTEQLSVTFSALQPSTHYTLIVRCPWAVQAQTDFTTPSLSAISTLSPDPVPALAPKYDLGGRPVGAGFKGVILQAGRKMLQGN